MRAGKQKFYANFVYFSHVQVSLWIYLLKLTSEDGFMIWLSGRLIKI